MNEYQKVLRLYQEYKQQTSLGKYIAAAFEDNEIEWLKAGGVPLPISDKNIWDFLESHWQAYDVLWLFICDLTGDTNGRKL